MDMKECCASCYYYYSEYGYDCCKKHDQILFEKIDDGACDDYEAELDFWECYLENKIDKEKEKKGTIRWMSVNPDTNEFYYDLGIKEFDTSQESLRDTIVNLLLHDWDSFGDDGDCMVIKRGVSNED